MMAAKQLAAKVGRDVLGAGRNSCNCSKSLPMAGVCRTDVKSFQPIHKILRTFFGGSKLRVAYYYQVTLETGDVFAAGTDANIYIKLIGERGITDEILIPTKKGDLERGMKNTYEVSADDVGPIKRVFVRHDNSGLGPAWFLNKITIQNHDKDNYLFNCNDWLRVSKSKGKLGLVKSVLEEDLKLALGSETAAQIEADTTFDGYTSMTEDKVHRKLERVLSEIVGTSNDDDNSTGNKANETDSAADKNEKTPPVDAPQIAPTSDKFIVQATESKTLPTESNAKQKRRPRKVKETAARPKTKRNESIAASNGDRKYLSTQSASLDIPLSPAVRLLLETHGLERQLILATGPKGRILKGDVLSYMKSGGKVSLADISKQLTPDTTLKPKPAAPKLEDPVSKFSGSGFDLDYIDIPNTNVRKTIARRLTEAKVFIPHSYVSTDCDVANVLNLRKKLKNDGILLTVNDFIVKAVAMALKKIPRMNSQWDGEGAVILQNVDVSVAVSTEKGLITPIVRDADQLELTQLSSTVREMAQRAREGKLKPEEYQGGSFTISNLGMFGLTHFSAIINPPQTCIMAVGGTKLSLATDGTMQSHVTVTLSYDGRALNEETTSKFLEAFKLYMENPYNCLST